MDYALIFALQLIGISLHVLQKLLELDKLSPTDTLGDVWALFWKSDKITLMISGVIIFFNLIAHYIVHVYAPKSITEYQYFDLIGFGIALVLGYGGQNLIYKWLGSAQTFLDKKVTDKLS